MTATLIDGRTATIPEYGTGSHGRSIARYSPGYVSGRGARRSCRSSMAGAQGELDFEDQSPLLPDKDIQSRAVQDGLAEYHRLIVETMIEGALILSSEGVILYCNSGFSRMVGLPAARLTGSRFSLLVHPDHRASFSDMIEACTAKGGAQREVVLQSGDGSNPAVYLSGTTQKVGEEEAVSLVVTDITKRVNAENALKAAKVGLEQAVETLRESQAKYLDLYENANDIVFTLDLKGRFTSANRTTYRELGLKPETTIGRGLLELLTPESARSASFLIDKALSEDPGFLEGQPWEFEATTEDGSVTNLEVRARLISENDRVVGIQCIARNITERKQVEMELTRLATAIEQAVESVVILDKSGKIQYANGAFFRVSGYSRDEVLGKSPAFLKTNKREDGSFYKGLLNTVNTKSVWTDRISSRKKDGTTYEAVTTIAPVRDKSGKIVNYVAVERDVTEEVRLESQLRQMQKMEAIGTLAGGIAHDFNNILSAIIGFSEMAIEDIAEGHPAKNYSAQILKAAIRGKDLVRQILMFSHKTEDDRKHFKLSLIAKEAMKLIRASLPSTIEIRERVEADGGVVFASPTQMHQVLMNLCTNAGHAMRQKGGVLEIGLAEFELDTVSEAPYLGMDPGFYLRLSVADTGAGMDKAVMERIFDPFFTTKSPSEGTGMGLAVVHGIVKSHGGAITVRSTPGKGTVFDVYLPRTDTTDQEEAEVVSDLRKGTERILLVDDEEAITEMGQSMLSRMGYQVHTVRDGVQALEVFSKEPASFDLVITDHTMPRMTGTQLAQELMAVRPGMPVILCTGYSEMINREMAKDLGIREFVMKPISRSEFADTIRRVLDGREEHV